MLVKQVKIWFKKSWRWLILVILALVFFIVTSFYISTTISDNFIKWASPDETANYVFSKLFGQTNNLIISEEYNLLVDDIIQPRSFRSDSGNLKPVSFLGIILIYGQIVKWVGYKILPFLTPFFASIGIIFYYLFIKKIFGQRNALISAFLLSSFPPFVYYTLRSMFHNVLFVVLLIIGLYFSLLMVSAKNSAKFNGYLKKLLFPALAGGFIGLAIITRSSELLWLLPVLLISWLLNIKNVGLVKLLIFLSFLFLAILPVLYWNQILYDSPINSGYPEMNQSIVNITSAGGDIIKSTIAGELGYNKNLMAEIKNNIFHFGFNFRQSIKMLYFYFTQMFYWLFWPALLGVFLFIQGINRWQKKHLVYLLSLAITSIILVFYYGSWVFHDNPDPNSYTIGNSYTRYWLPIYLGLIPFASHFIIKFTRAIFSITRKPDLRQNNLFINQNKKSPQIFTKVKKSLGKPRKYLLINSSRIIIIFIFYLISLHFILDGSEEGLISTAGNNQQAKYEFDQVISLTENNSVIITRYHDKIFFPERKVIVGLFDNDEMNKRYSILVNYLPVYYYNFTFPEKDINYLNERRLVDFGLKIEEVEKITS
ncbi:MAG: glycosyltransferase family 39 protein, partial [Patescibacteria group bacterium]